MSNNCFSFQIENVGAPGKCVDSLGQFYKEIGMYYCHSNRVYPSGHQHYFLGHNRDIEFYSDAAYCIEPRNGRVELVACHHQQGAQYFRYDVESQQMFCGKNEDTCLEAGDIKLVTKPCDANNKFQKWKWGSVNEENLRNWKVVGAKIA